MPIVLSVWESNPVCFQSVTNNQRSPYLFRRPPIRYVTSLRILRTIDRSIKVEVSFTRTVALIIDRYFLKMLSKAPICKKSIDIENLFCVGCTLWSNRRHSKWSLDIGSIVPMPPKDCQCFDLKCDISIVIFLFTIQGHWSDESLKSAGASENIKLLIATIYVWAERTLIIRKQPVKRLCQVDQKANPFFEGSAIFRKWNYIELNE